MITFIIGEVILAHGAGRISEAGSDRQTHSLDYAHAVGVDLVEISLFIQLASVKVSMILLAIWHARVKRHSLLTKKLKFVLVGQYVTAAFTIGRCVYRIVEFFEGTQGHLNTHEAYFYVFEAGFMLAVAYTLNICHPGRCFPRDMRVYLAKDGRSEVVGPGLTGPKRRLHNRLRNYKATDFWDEPPESPSNLVELGRCSGRC
jgi:hypothetical protein